MPLMKCTDGGKPGWKYGDKGKCYTYEPGSASGQVHAKEKARRQGAAIELGKTRAEPSTKLVER